MLIRVDFNSDEAIYMQLCRQIIIGIANAQIKEGDNLPSVRELAEDVGINMHTVNKAYSILKQEGYLKVDRRHGAIIAVEVDRYKAKMELAEEMKLSIAKAISRGITREETKEMIDEIYDLYLGGR
ncbi:MAG: GntR family transcriptional regulator [Clostridiales bacterium]|nr:GntR family transcriptional regulator [Clostridiales bacterium]MDE7422381.1 GntR family transcriptional regulator [Lachnospiraceae bacterium]